MTACRRFDIFKEVTMNILFLGNSLIFYNDLPAMFERLARAAGKEITVGSVTKGSATVSHFASETDPLGQRAREALTAQRWDYVLIEPSRRITPFEDSVLQAETEAAKTVQQLAAQAGAEILLYAVWGNNDGVLRECVAEEPPHMPFVRPHPISRAAHTQFLHDTSHRISAALGGALIAEAGYAFENMIEADPTVELYHTDLRHPSPAGTYLTACTLLATLCGERTEGIPPTEELPCTALQRVADATVLSGKIPLACEG